MARPNVLVILTDQLRRPPAYESAELARWRAEAMPGIERLRREGVSFAHHYAMATACAPSRASLLTGQYPSLHGVTQTDGFKGADEVTWLAPDGVPTIGDWFRAAGYRTYYKGKWHASHAHLADDDGGGYLLSIDDDGVPIEANVDRYLEADLLHDYGFSEWVGPEPHGLGRHNTGTVKDPFTADETIDLLKRLTGERSRGEEGAPWLTVCSFLNPHDDSLFGVIGLAQGLRYQPSRVPHVAQAPTHDEDLSTKPSCHASYNEEWGKILAPQPWIETHLKFYHQLQATVDEQVTRVLDALAASPAGEETIVVFSFDHGDMQGAHGGMHEKWHVAYEEALRVPLIVSWPARWEGGREVEMPTSHADLLPTLLGLAGIEQEAALATLRRDHDEARPLVGRDLSGAVRGDRPGVVTPDPILFTTDDEISEGPERAASPFQKAARRLRLYSEVAQPNHLETIVAEVEVGGEPHLVKFTRYHDSPEFWTVPGERDELRGRRTLVVTEPEPDEFELYDLTLDPYEERNLAHPSFADAGSRELEARMFDLLSAQLERQRLVPDGGEAKGYRAPDKVG
jgi:arylsulfatase A-like enzyme